MKQLLLILAKILSTRRYTLVVFDRHRRIQPRAASAIETEQGNLFDILTYP
ncbi:MAG: hypothetical protein KGI03_00875 [Patescibacteria group bacterium]|nr:hypothetical protein [Patescibacteria group bacterium]